MTRLNFLKFWSAAVGLMDALTGLLLVLSPRFVLGMLQIEPPGAEALVFLSWIGVFVASVGMSYGFALGGRRSRGETVWLFTALVRSLVAVFLTAKILTGALPAGWVLVAGADAAVALVQMVVVRKGWWREAGR